MHLERSRGLVPVLWERASSPSTNTELAELAATETLAPFTTLVTLDQTAGRGRLDRTWVAPAGASLAISVLVPIPAQGAGWIPLVAGLAMRRAVDAVLAEPRARLKWPNDVLIDGLKACGILAELTPAGAIVGAGLNVAMTADQLPVPTATSLMLAGPASEESLIDRVLAGYLEALLAGMTALAPGSASVRDELRAVCSTLGRDVRVELPGGGDLVGRAVDVDEHGRLVVRTPDGVEAVVAAGDVTHVRTTD